MGRQVDLPPNENKQVRFEIGDPDGNKLWELMREFQIDFSQRTNRFSIEKIYIIHAITANKMKCKNDQCFDSNEIWSGHPHLA